MANPAELLYDLFSEWNNGHRSAQQARSDDSLKQHLRAVRLVMEIEELIKVLERRGERTNSYRRHLPAWKKTIFNYPGHWAGNGTGAIPNTQLEILDTLVDRFSTIVQPPEGARLETLKGFLDSVMEGLEDDDSLPAVVKDSAISVIKNLRQCIDELDLYGDFAFLKAYEQMLGTLAVVALRSQRKSRWKRILDVAIYPYAVGNLPELDSAASAFGELMSAIGNAG